MGVISKEAAHGTRESASRPAAHAVVIAGGANGNPAIAGYLRDEQGRYQPYGVVVLEVVGDRISRIVSFGDPRLLPFFGFENGALEEG